jgi:flagellar biosynthesis/type III secretory pathway chaperone
MDPKACLAQLANMLAEESRLLGLLAMQLQGEHALLVANDVDGLEQAASARQSSVAALARLDQDRHSLCRALGHGADQTGMAAMLKWCDPAGSLAAAHAGASHQAQLCRDQNDRNGALVNARLNRLNSMLGKLSGNAAPGTYASRGVSRGPAAVPAARILSITA